MLVIGARCASSRSRSTSLGVILGSGAFFTPALAEAVALCLMFGVLPLIGLALLVQSILGWIRTGRLETYRRGGVWNVYYRSNTPVQFWVALTLKATYLFALCALPLALCVLIALPRLIAILRGAGAT
jgi:hypothetical protein